MQQSQTFKEKQAKEETFCKTIFDAGLKDDTAILLASTRSIQEPPTILSDDTSIDSTTYFLSVLP